MVIKLFVLITQEIYTELLTLGIGLAIAFVVRIVIGMVDHNQVFVLSINLTDG
jgi:hypothetical protein